MMPSRNNPNYQVQSEQYRSEAAKLSELRGQTDRVVTDAIREGRLHTAHEALEVLHHHTGLFNDLRQRYTPREIFMFAYGVEVINDYTVSFVLPKGTSRISMLREAQIIFKADTDEDLVYQDQLFSWSRSKRYTETIQRSQRLCIEGFAPGSDGLNLKQQTSLLAERNLVMPESHDLALAFAAFYVATDKPLFRWFEDDGPKSAWTTYFIRAQGPSLYFDNEGLSETPVKPYERRQLVAAAALLASEHA
jgi:hypothetical protein